MDTQQVIRELEQLAQMIRRAYGALEPVRRNRDASDIREALRQQMSQVRHADDLRLEGNFDGAAQAMPRLEIVEQLCRQAKAFVAFDEPSEQQQSFSQEPSKTQPYRYGHDDAQPLPTREPGKRRQQPHRDDVNATEPIRATSSDELGRRLKAAGLSLDDVVSAARKARGLDTWSERTRAPKDLLDGVKERRRAQRITHQDR